MWRKRSFPRLPATERQAQREQIGAAAVPQLDPLEVVPDAFGRVQVRCIAGQALQTEPLRCPSRQKVFDRLPLMDRRSIPDDEHTAADLAQQLSQEPHHRLGRVGRLPHLQEEPPVEREAADRGEMVAGQLDAQDRRLAARGPGASRMRQEIEPRLVYPDDGVPFVDRFF